MQRVTPQEVQLREICEQQVRLVQLSGENTGRTFSINMGNTAIGSGTQSSLIIADKSVSRQHCVVERDANFVRIRDLASTNGTAVDGVPIESAFLRSGSKLHIGSVLFAVEIGYTPMPLDEKMPHHGFRGLVGESPIMRSVFAARDRLAGTDVTVLIQGETGTGKSALARSIHGASTRRHSPFVVFDCGSVAPSLVESALFGHEQGAFTGAMRQHAGVLETAGDGTLFIDELAELPADLQPKLLRALEERVFVRVGSNKQYPVRCRVIGASQSSIWSMVQQGKFRKDLYFRLAVVTVPLPALRERREDIPLLVNQLLTDLQITDRSYDDFDEQTQTQIMAHDWPGNIRELRNFLERRVRLDEHAEVVVNRETPASDPIQTQKINLRELLKERKKQDDNKDTAPVLAFPLDLGAQYREMKEKAVAELERIYFAGLLERCKYNVSEVARRSGVNRRHVHELLSKHGLGRAGEDE